MFKKLGVQTKLTFGCVLVVLVTLLCTSAINVWSSKNGYMEKSHELLQGVSNTLINTLQTKNELTAKALQSELNVFDLQFSLKGFPVINPLYESEVTLQNGEQAGESVTLPGLKLGNTFLNEDNSLVDTVSDTVGDDVSVLLQNDNQFVRIATTLQDQSDTRNTGGVLPADHAAAQKLAAGESYTGTVRVMGQLFLAAYQPLFDLRGEEVVGALEVVRPLLTPALAQTLGRLNVNGQGHSLAVAPSGRVLLSPGKQQEEHWTHTPLATEDGENADQVRSYTQKGQERFAAVNYFAPWDMYVVTTVGADALSQGINSQVWSAAGISAAPSLALALVVIWLISRQIMHPMKRLAARSEQIVRGEQDVTFDDSANDVIGQTARSLEAMLRQLNNRMAFAQALLEGISLPYVVVDRDNRITAVNEAALNIIERPGEPADFHGAEVEDFLGLDPRAIFVTRQALDTDQFTEKDVVVAGLGSGSRIHLRVSANPIYDAQGELIGCFALWVDMSSERAHEQRMGQLAETTQDQAVSGDAVVQQSLAAMQEVHGYATRLQQDTSELEEAVTAINDVIHLISGVANQTNLLALNAAVEAARAGQAGRGFAVVAEEVRHLAVKTQQATKDVETRIEAIQAKSHSTAATTAEAVQAASRGNRLASEAGEVMHNLVAAVQQSAQEVRHTGAQGTTETYARQCSLSLPVRRASESPGADTSAQQAQRWRARIAV